MFIIRHRQLSKQAQLCTSKGQISNLIRSYTTEFSPEKLHAIESFISNLTSSNSSPNDFEQYKKLVKSLPKESISLLSEKILSVVKPFSRNNPVFKAALASVDINRISPQAVDNMLDILPELTQVSHLNGEIQSKLTNFFLDLSIKDRSLIPRFEKRIEGFETRRNKAMLISLYLRNNELDKAYDYIFNTISKSEDRLRPASIELVIHHLCHREQLTKASHLVHLAQLNNYELFPRTLSTFLSKAIELGEVKICYKHYKTILERIFIDNGSLINLIEVISPLACISDIKALYKIFRLKDRKHIPLNFVKRYKRCLIEVKARDRGFRHAFLYLVESGHELQQLRVADYPELLSKVEVSQKMRKVEFTLLKRMNYENMTPITKKFYIELIMAKLVESDQTYMGLEILKNHSKMRKLINEETLSLMIRSIEKNKSNLEVDTFVEIVKLKPTLRLHRIPVIDTILKVVANSDYWFNSLLILDRIQLRGNHQYTIEPKTYEQLQIRFQEVGKQDTLEKYQKRETENVE